MHEQIESPKERLKIKVVSLVKEFVKTEGGVTIFDLLALFGNPVEINGINEISSTLAAEMRLGGRNSNQSG